MEGSLVAYKVFTNGSVLNASEINDNLMNQSVMVFSNAAARTAAITSPVEGMVTYTEDNNVISIYDGAWKIALTPTGGILQVVSFTTTTTTTTTSSSFQNTSLTASITPKSASSKILISFSCGLEGTTNQSGSDLGLFRGNVSGTQLGSTSIAGNYLGTSMSRLTPASAVFLDSPATASSVSYMVGLKSGGTNSAVIRDQQTMILMEVAG
jgi:hypothetical protein